MADRQPPATPTAGAPGRPSQGREAEPLASAPLVATITTSDDDEALLSLLGGEAHLARSLDAALPFLSALERSGPLALEALQALLGGLLGERQVEVLCRGTSADVVGRVLRLRELAHLVEVTGPRAAVGRTEAEAETETAARGAPIMEGAQPGLALPPTAHHRAALGDAATDEER